VEIVVLGMHRAGTSLVTRLINMMGAYFGPEGMALAPSVENPKGFWERHDVLQCNDAILRLAGCHWDKLGAWQRPPLLPDELTRRLHYIVLGMDAFRPWVMKDPRLCLTLPCWRKFLEVPVAVIVWRHPLECARSLEMRNGMPKEWGLALWEYHAVGALNASADMPRTFVGHHEAIADPVGTVQRLYDQLTRAEVAGLRLPSAREITAFVEPRLYRARVENHGEAALSAWHSTLFNMLRGATPVPHVLQVDAAAMHAMKRFSPTETL